MVCRRGLYSIAQDGRTISGWRRRAGRPLDPGEFDRAIKSPHYVMRFRIYDTSDGLAGYPVAPGDRNAVRAGGWDALVRHQPRHLGGRSAPARARPRPAPLVAIDEADSGRPAGVDGNVLPPGTAKLQIDYTAPELTSPLKTRFRYRLEGFDADWVDAGTRRQALYTNLPPRGLHRSASPVSQDDGRWSETRGDLGVRAAPALLSDVVVRVALAVASLAGITWAAGRSGSAAASPVLAGPRRTGPAEPRTARHAAAEPGRGRARVRRGRRRPSRARRPRPGERVIKIREQVEEYIREARRSIWSLRSPALETGDLMEALRDSAARAAAGHDRRRSRSTSRANRGA